MKRVLVAVAAIVAWTGVAGYGAIQGWNAASVYQQAIAIMGKQIDGN